MGDIMQHDSQIQSAFNASTGQYNYEHCFRFVKKYFMEADLTIGNLEVTLGGKPYKGYPQFSAPDALAASLKIAGVNVLVTANNHSVDRRKKGLERTIRVLDSLKILHTGTFRDTVERLNDYPLLIAKNGINLALLNYTYGTNGIPVTKPNVVNLIDTAVIRKDLQQAKNHNPDLTIVFLHWGNEYQSQPSKQQKELAEWCFRHGANLVIGSHPHVLQPMEWRKEREQVVIYSLGNFISGQRDRYRDGAAMVKVELSKIYYSDSVAVTSIGNVGYVLQWVYKTADSKRNFYVLPVPDFEGDTTSFIVDEASRLAFSRFVEDSRKLLGSTNRGVNEITQPASDSTVLYRIAWLVPAMEKDLSAGLSPTDFRFGIDIDQDALGNQQIWLGSFRKRKDAEEQLKRLLVRYPEAKLVTWVNGNPQE
ncbi:CapA family protein [Oscillatoria amoena NRMC-F 0135]|nr:CapA family protein [Oscillatoria amoena NRMC-F 0135]